MNKIYAVFIKEEYEQKWYLGECFSTKKQVKQFYRLDKRNSTNLKDRYKDYSGDKYKIETYFKKNEN